MGEGTPRVEITGKKVDYGPPRATAQHLNGEITIVRQDLDTLLAELDRRRHEVMDFKFQLRQHAMGVGLATVGLLGSAAGSVLFRMRRHQRREGITAQAGRLSHAVSRMIERPEQVAAEPTVVGKIALAAANAAVASLIKKLLERGVEYLLKHDASPARAEPRLGRRSGDINRKRGL
jgi:hypothetical protein